MRKWKTKICYRKLSGFCRNRDNSRKVSLQFEPYQLVGRQNFRLQTFRTKNYTSSLSNIPWTRLSLIKELLSMTRLFALCEWPDEEVAQPRASGSLCNKSNVIIYFNFTVEIWPLIPIFRIHFSGAFIYLFTHLCNVFFFYVIYPAIDLFAVSKNLTFTSIIVPLY